MIRRIPVISYVIVVAGSGILYAAPQQPTPSAVSPTANHRALLNKYCVTCHSDKLKTGGLTLQSADLSKVPENADIWEKVIKKIRVEAMPPQGMPRHDKSTLDLFAYSLENAIDTQAALRPNPGRYTL